MQAQMLLLADTALATEASTRSLQRTVEGEAMMNEAMRDMHCIAEIIDKSSREVQVLAEQARSVGTSLA